MKLLSLICFTVLLNEFTAHGAGTCDNTQTYLQTISQESSGLAYSDPTTSKCLLIISTHTLHNYYNNVDQCFVMSESTI